MEKQHYMYRYVTENDYVSKLYHTMGGLKQVINNTRKDHAKYPYAGNDTSKWMIERIPITPDRFMSVDVFLNEKPKKVFWEFSIKFLRRAYIRSTRTEAYHAFLADVAKEWPLQDMSGVEITEYMGEIDV